MIVVADTGPLHYLILLDHADLLHRFYGERQGESMIGKEGPTMESSGRIRT